MFFFVCKLLENTQWFNCCFSGVFLFLVSRAVIRPMIIGQLKMNMKNFEELKICSDILNEMLSNYDSVERVVSNCAS